MQLGTLNIIYAVSFIDLLAIGIIAPLQAAHYRSLNATHTTIGLLRAEYAAVQIFAGPLIGGWSDVQDRKFVLESIIFLCAVLYGFLGLTNSIFLIFIIRFFIGLFKNVQSVCKAVITDLVPPDRQTSAFGKSAALGSLGFTLGPFIGGHLSEFENGFNYCNFLVAGLFILNGILASRIPNIPKKTKQSNHVAEAVYSNAIKRINNEFKKTVKELKDIDWSVHTNGFLLRLLFGLTINCILSNETLFLKEELLLSQAQIGYVISFSGMIGMTSAYFLNYITALYTDDRFFYKRTLHFFILLMFSLLGFYFTSGIFFHLLFLIPFSLSSTMLRITTMEILFKNSTESHTGSLSGASNSTMSVARFLAFITTGILGDLLTVRSVILLSLVPSLLGIFLSVKMKHNADNSVEKKVQ